jgi:hypothetical protein
MVCSRSTRWTVPGTVSTGSSYGAISQKLSRWV